MQETFDLNGLKKPEPKLDLTNSTCQWIVILIFCSYVILRMNRSSLPEVFLIKGVPKTCSKFTGEHPYRSVISIKLLRTLAWVFSCKFAGYFRSTFRRNTSGWLLVNEFKDPTKQESVNIGQVLFFKMASILLTSKRSKQTDLFYRADWERSYKSFFYCIWCFDETFMNLTGIYIFKI